MTHLDPGTTSRSARSLVTLVTVLVLLVAASLAHADVHFAVRPSLVNVQPGEVFEVELTITEAGSAFNGYDAVVGYDPAVLTFQQRPQAQQEGPLMTGACPNRFHDFHAMPADGILSVTHVLLCAGVSVTGPGVVYRLQFVAGQNNATTSISLLDGTAFYLAGVYVTPVFLENAEVQISLGTGTPPTIPELGLNLRVWPNPFNPRTTISFDAADAGLARLAVFDVRGVLVRQLFDLNVDAGPHAVVWDGNDEKGMHVGSGVYLVRLDVSGQRSARSVTLTK